MKVFRRDCRRKTSECEVTYTGKEDAIHQWSKEICAGDEIGWDFVDSVINSKMSFTAFVRRMTRSYVTIYEKSPSFMSVNTFVSWFFSWAAAMKIDFLSSVDPWCKHDPKFLAGDGTHVGVALRYIDPNIRMEKCDTDLQETPRHKRYQRVFIPYDGVHDAFIRKCRTHLDWICSNILSLQREELLKEEEEQRNADLLSIVTDDRVLQIVQKMLLRTFDQDVLQRLSYIVKNLCQDAPVIAFLPWRFLDDLTAALRELKHNQNVVHSLLTFKDVSPEISDLLQLSLNTPHFSDIVHFIEYLIDFVKDVHSEDIASEQIPVSIPGTYNPEKGIAYYFTPHGNQVRKVPTYNIRAAANYDDVPERDGCSKTFPSVSRGGFSYMFLWFCAIHGHCYGFHLIPGAEGRKDPFFSLYKYLPNPPNEVFYDFGCSLNEYSLNRAPGYSRSVRFWHDIFHGFNHKCPYVYRSNRIRSLNLVNSEICEQFNAFIQCIKYTGSHLNQSHFCFFMQFFIKVWNDRKTKTFQRRTDVAAACAV